MRYQDIANHAMLDESFKRGLLAAAAVARAQGDSCPPYMIAIYIERLANGEMP